MLELGISSNVIKVWSARAVVAAEAKAETTAPARHKQRSAVSNEAAVESARAWNILLVFMVKLLQNYPALLLTIVGLGRLHM